MAIFVSLIIPVYNTEKYLVQCLDSVVYQTVPFDEVIIINDGSTDYSKEICERYVSAYKYFRLVNQENRGLSSARNKGICETSGEYVMFLDSDDYLRADTVKTLKDELRKFRWDAIYFDADICCEKGYEVDSNIYERNIMDLNRINMSGMNFFKKCYPENYTVSACLAVYRKRAIEEAGTRFPEGLYFEDNYFTFAFMVRAQNVTYISEKLYQRRYRENSITTSGFSEKKFADYIRIVLLVWEVAAEQKKAAFGESKILARFISDYCYLALGYYCLCKEQNIVLRDETRKEFQAMVDIYESLLNLFCLDNENTKEDLPLLNLILRNLKNINLHCPQYKGQSGQMAVKLTKNQKQLYRELLSDLPLNIKGRKVGIYGTGKHTDGLLTIYEDLFGEIVCDLVFIDSNRTNGKYRGREIINYKEIESSFDMIIISSCRYKKEMADNIRNMDKETSIYDFYRDLNEDVFSEWGGKGDG